MKHHVPSRVPDAARRALRDDPALRALYRAKTRADLDTLIAGMTAAQRQALLEGLARLGWYLIRTLR